MQEIIQALQPFQLVAYTSGCDLTIASNLPEEIPSTFPEILKALLRHYPNYPKKAEDIAMEIWKKKDRYK